MIFNGKKHVKCRFRWNFRGNSHKQSQGQRKPNLRGSGECLCSQQYINHQAKPHQLWIFPFYLQLYTNRVIYIQNQRLYTTPHPYSVQKHLLELLPRKAYKSSKWSLGRTEKLKMSTATVENMNSEVQLTIETSVDADRSPTEEQNLSSDESDASFDEGEGSYESDNELEKVRCHGCGEWYLANLYRPRRRCACCSLRTYVCKKCLNWILYYCYILYNRHYRARGGEWLYILVKFEVSSLGKTS